MRITRRQALKGAAAGFVALLADELYRPPGLFQMPELGTLQPARQLPVTVQEAASDEPYYHATGAQIYDPAAFSGLNSVFQKEIGSFDGEAAVAVTDLLDGETISINGGRRFLTGCTINIFPYLNVWEDIQSSRYELDRGLYGLLVQGIAWSQPKSAAPLLIRTSGSLDRAVARANDLRKRLGAINSVMTHEPLYGSPEDGDNYFTADDANLVLKKLWNGEIIGNDATYEALDLLKRNPHRSVDFIIPRYLPVRGDVAHKIGYHWDTTGWVFDDMGIVDIRATDDIHFPFSFAYFSQRGKVLTVREKEEGNYKYHDGEGAKLGARLARAAFDHVLRKYGFTEIQLYGP